MSAILKDILDAVKDRIQGLGLTDMTDDKIQIAQVMNSRETVFPGLPGILIVPIGAESMSPTAGTVGKDDIGYPIGVAILDETRQDTQDGLPADAQAGAADQDYNFFDKLEWREMIRKAFFHQRLDGVPTVYTCHVEPMPIVDTVEWLSRGGIWISMLVLRFISRETRGMTI